MRAIARMVIVALIFGALGVAVVGGSAHACSCVRLAPREAIADQDGAVVGTVTDTTGGADGSMGVMRIEVERVIKGDIGPTVDIAGVGSGAACGLGVQGGERVGLILYVRNGVWISNACLSADPDVLLEAAEPYPPPDGEGPIRYLLAADLGEAALVALDDRGRTLAYGYGPEDIDAIHVCPGQRRVVTTYRHEDEAGIVVRDLRSLEPVRRVEVMDEEGWPSLPQVACLDRRAAHIVAMGCLRAGREASVWLVDGSEPTLVAEVSGDARGSVFAGGMAYVIDRSVLIVDPEVGVTGNLMNLAGRRPIASISPSGTWYAALERVEGDGQMQPRLRVGSMSGDPERIVPMESTSPVYDLGWADEQTLAVALASGRTILIDAGTHRRVGSFRGWQVIRQGDHLAGIGDEGLVFAPAPGVPASVPVPVPQGGGLVVLAGVPGHVQAAPGPDPGEPDFGPGGSAATVIGSGVPAWLITIVGALALALVLVAVRRRVGRARDTR